MRKIIVVAFLSLSLNACVSYGYKHQEMDEQIEAMQEDAQQKVIIAERAERKERREERHEERMNQAEAYKKATDGQNTYIVY